MRPPTPPPADNPSERSSEHSAPRLEIEALRSQLSAALRTSVVIDVETTGLSPEEDRIVEIAVLEVKDGAIRRRFHSLVNPDRPIPAETTRIHGIKDEDVAGAPTFEALLPQLGALLSSQTLVGHNVAFDVGFLAAAFRRCGEYFSLGTPPVCTAKAARLLIPREAVGRYTLANVADHCGLSVGQCHRASADAELTFGLLGELEQLAA